MAIQEKLYTVDNVWELSHRPENHDKYFYLIDGELYWDMPPGGEHGNLAFEIGYHLRVFLEQHDLGKGTVETGYYPPDDRNTLLAPDVAFISKSRAPQPFPNKFVPAMPDLAVEILSPTDSLAEVRRKAVVYLANGTRLVWIVLPAEKGVDVCRASEGDGLNIEFVGLDGSLSGETILPGFELELKLLFPES
ncbi:MAG: Uma2 family endonuclease [Chloroflexota bacterium]|nr:Uma2 family endonuclease [Chloroflexota bacterium]MDE2947679.1 Uma2 family endonuclease [Chloroflexota bacterium]